jgi:hypothetical protein
MASKSQEIVNAEPVSAMDPKQQIELTIRTAQLIKSLSNLVGVEDAKIACLMFYECVPQMEALRKFLDAHPSQRT